MVDKAELLRGISPLQQRIRRQEEERRIAEATKLQEAARAGEIAKVEEQQARYEEAQAAYGKEMSAYKAAKEILEKRARGEYAIPHAGSPVGTYSWIKKLEAKGLGAPSPALLMSRAGTYEVEGQLFTIDPTVAGLPEGAVYVGPPGYIPPTITEVRPPTPIIPELSSAQRELYEAMGFPEPSPAQRELYEAMGWVGVATPFGVQFRPPTGIPARIPPPTGIPARIPPPTPWYKKVWEAITPRGFEEKFTYPMAMRTKYKGREIPIEEWREKELREALAARARLEKAMPLVRIPEWIERFGVAEPTRLITGQYPPKWQREMIQTYFTFVLFSPWLSTGVAAKQSQQKVILKDVEKKVTKKNFYELVRGWREKLIREAGARQELRTRYIKALETRDPKTIKQAKDLIKELLGKDASQFVKDAQTQFTQTAAITPTIELPEVVAPSITKIPVAEIATGIYAGLGIYDVPTEVYEERIRREEWLKGRGIEDYGKPYLPAIPVFEEAVTIPKPTIESITLPSQIDFTASLTSLGAASLLKTGLTPKEALREFQAEQEKQMLRERQRLAVTPVTMLGLGVAQEFFQPSKLVPKVPTIPKYPHPFFPRLKPPKLKLPKLLFPPFKIPRAERIRRLRRIPRRVEDGFIPQVRRKGKWIPIGRARDPLRAAIIGKRRVERTLAASLRVIGPRGIVPLAPFGPKWRRAKKEPLVLVEKARFRLDVPSETAELQRARRLKKGKSKKSKSKKKKKRRGNWWE